MSGKPQPIADRNGPRPERFAHVKASALFAGTRRNSIN
jgi:hypothetical protein